MSPTDYLYYHFVCPPKIENDIFVVYIHDRSSRSRINPTGLIYLNANGIPVATVRPLETLTFPEMAKATADVSPSAVIEFRYSAAKKILIDNGRWQEPGIVRFECVDANKKPLSESAVFGFPVGNNLPVPSEDNIRRVAGRLSPQNFLITGACWYMMIQNVIESEFNGHLEKTANILDWGVGCGRIARYFLGDGYNNLSGIDIDQFNIDWCNKHLKSADFNRCDYDPPTVYEDNHFELIYSHSVFTHLNLESEKSWLTELNRLLSPSGVACVTFISDVGMYLNHNKILVKNPSWLSSFWQTGRTDLGAMSVGVDKNRPGYYRVVTHTHDYVLSEWSKFVDIVRIIPGFANNQDAVLFRKKQ